MTSLIVSMRELPPRQRRQPVRGGTVGGQRWLPAPRASSCHALRRPDPGITLCLLATPWAISAVESRLNNKSGVLGLSGRRLISVTP